MTEQSDSGLLHSDDLAERSGGSRGTSRPDHDEGESHLRLGPSRGLVLGVLLGLAFWAIIGAMIWL